MWNFPVSRLQNGYLQTSGWRDNDSIHLCIWSLVRIISIFITITDSLKYNGETACNLNAVTRHIIFIALFPRMLWEKCSCQIQMAGVTVKASPYAKLSEFSLNQEALYIYTGGPGLFKSRQKNLLIYLFIKMTFCGSLNLKRYEIVVYQSISWSGTVAWQPGPVLKVFSPPPSF